MDTTDVAEGLGNGRASARVLHYRRKRAPDGSLIEPTYDADGNVELSSVDLISDETTWNVITNSGRDFLHTQGYATAGIGTNGLNYIALSNDTLTETATSTTLSTEIAANGLARAQGTVNHTAGTNTTTVSRTFNATGTQSCQKAALFTAAAAGTMNHALAFTQRNLVNGDSLQVTFTITLG